MKKNILIFILCSLEHWKWGRIRLTAVWGPSDKKKTFPALQCLDDITRLTQVQVESEQQSHLWPRWPPRPISSSVVLISVLRNRLSSSRDSEGPQNSAAHPGLCGCQNGNVTQMMRCNHTHLVHVSQQPPTGSLLSDPPPLCARMKHPNTQWGNINSMMSVQRDGLLVVPGGGVPLTPVILIFPLVKSTSARWQNRGGNWRDSWEPFANIRHWTVFVLSRLCGCANCWYADAHMASRADSASDM